jgi:hypothetical protein
MPDNEAISGVDDAKARLRAACERKWVAQQRGLAKAGLVLKALSMKVVPVDYGFLKASAYVATPIAKPEPGTYTVIVGYGAKYAIYVHENPFALHGERFNEFYAPELAAYHRGQGGPFRHNRGPDQAFKFLEAPFRRNIELLREIVAREVRNQK